jgi:hypothetical protein
MTLLAVSEKRSGSPDLRHPENKQPVESLELSLREANILFDDQQRPILVVTAYSSTHITTPHSPHWTLRQAGYFQATDDEIDILRQGGYQLPDWRALTIVDMSGQFPDWKLATNESPKADAAKLVNSDQRGQQ